MPRVFWEGTVKYASELHSVKERRVRIVDKEPPYKRNIYPTLRKWHEEFSIEYLHGNDSLGQELWLVEGEYHEEALREFLCTQMEKARQS